MITANAGRPGSGDGLHLLACDLALFAKLRGRGIWARSGSDHSAKLANWMGLNTQGLLVGGASVSQPWQTTHDVSALGSVVYEADLRLGRRIVWLVPRKEEPRQCREGDDGSRDEDDP